MFVRILLCLFILASSLSATTYWQVTFSYDPTGLRVDEITPIAPMQKTPSTPGLAGAPAVITYSAQWQDAASQLLYQSDIKLPIGVRQVFETNTPCVASVPESGVFVVRVAGPDDRSAQPATLKLERRDIAYHGMPSQVLPTAFQPSVQSLPISRISTAAAALAGPVGVTKIRNTGPDGNRLVIVIMGDGYTAANLTAGSFTTAANTMVNAFVGKVPWDILFAGTNVYRVDVESNQQGSDNDPQGTFKDTYLNSSFYTNNIARLLALDGTGYNRAYSAANTLVGAGVWDYIIVMVNSTTYGGSGGSIAVSSVHSLAPEIVLHETGHTFCGLADEYTDAYPGFPPGDGEPNVDYDFSGPSLKWNAWVAPGTPLPTPDNSTYNNVVGAFQGARYLTTGIYRPMRTCLMKTLSVPLCTICKEQHVLEYLALTSFADSVLLSGGPGTYLVNSTGKLFGIIPSPITGAAYSWTIGDSAVTGAHAATLQFTGDMMAARGKTSGVLTLKVTYPSPLIRLASPQETYSWNVLADCNDNGIRDDADVAFGTSLDVNANGIPDECESGCCCIGDVGNADCDATQTVDIGDLTTLINNLFITFTPLCCPQEANIDGVGGVDVGDLTALINTLFITFAPLSACGCP